MEGPPPHFLSSLAFPKPQDVLISSAALLAELLAGRGEGTGGPHPHPPVQWQEVNPRPLIKGSENSGWMNAITRQQVHAWQEAEGAEKETGEREQS